jgi:transcription elongation factor Elf1
MHTCVCNKEFETNELLESHYMESKPCFTWQRKISRDDELATYIQQQSKDLNKDFLCISCNRPYSTRYNLNKHHKKSTICGYWNTYYQFTGKTPDDELDFILSKGDDQNNDDKR